jgi:hypothetical protein
MLSLPAAGASLRGTTPLAFASLRELYESAARLGLSDADIERLDAELRTPVAPRETEPATTVIRRHHEPPKRPQCPVRRNSRCIPDYPRQPKKAWPDRRYIEDSLDEVELQTRQGGTEGVVGRIGMRIIKALFDLELSNGDMVPDYATIASRASCGERSVGGHLANLRRLGILDWVNRSKPSIGLFPFVQTSNAYFIRPPSEWKCWIAPSKIKPPPPRPLLPLPDELGAHPHREPLDLYKQLVKEGASLKDRLAALESDPADRIAVAAAKVHRASKARRHTLPESIRTGNVPPKPPS